MLERSYLFVPGNRPERIQKAMDSGADAVIIDLEDAVAPEEKETARRRVRKTVEEFDTVHKKLYVRVNDRHTPFWKEDVAFVAHHHFFSGVMLPKTESAEDIERLAANLSAEQTIIPLIETAKGVMSAFAIASASKKVFRLAFGAVDYCLDLGIARTSSGKELLYPRSALAVASRAAEIAPPIDTVYIDFQEDEGLIADTKRAKQLGMLAKLCIHPRQVEIVNRMFTPSETELNWAKEVITVYEEAKKEGRAAVNHNGTMVDFPVYKQALQLLKRVSSQKL